MSSVLHNMQLLWILGQSKSGVGDEDCCSLSRHKFGTTLGTCLEASNTVLKRREFTPNWLESVMSAKEGWSLGLGSDVTSDRLRS
jgi:hypothetical protein